MQTAASPSSSPFASVPPGWTTEVDTRDGRLFYYNAATGAATWTHPHAPPSNDQPDNGSTPARNSGTRDGPQPPPFDYVSTPQQQGYHAAGRGEENPYIASRRPDNHQCSALAALLLCPPLGVFAMYHSIRVDQCWKTGQYSDSVIHARQAPQFGSWGIMLGGIFWICWFFFRRGRGEWEWPEWNIGD